MSKQIEITQGQYAIVDDEDFEFLSQWKWQYNGRYARRSQHISYINGVRKQKVVFMHRVIAGTPEGMETDHINGDTLNNTKANLRSCTRHQNGRNRKKSLGKTSKFKGVVWHTRDKVWEAAIRINWKPIYLGRFRNEEDAALAYNFAAQEYFGDFANLNKAA